MPSALLDYKNPNVSACGTSAIDSLGEVSFQTFGVHYRFRSNRVEHLAHMMEIPIEWEISRGPINRSYEWHAEPDCHRLYVDGEKLIESDDIEAILDCLESDLQIHLADRSPGRVFIHAGVVRWQGCAIVIPGRSFSGKSTLVAAFIRAGASYYSDEFAVIDFEGFVHPYHRLLSLRRPHARPERSTAEQLGGQRGAIPSKSPSSWSCNIALALYGGRRNFREGGRCWK